MKNILFSLMAVLLFFTHCTSQKMPASGITDNLISQKEFTFMAERVTSISSDVINVAGLNSSYGNIQSLSYGYGIIFKNNEMMVHLPFFGRAYTATRNQDEGGLKFTSKDFTFEQTENKKGKKTITVKPNDVNSVNTIYFEINKNGKCYVSINSNDKSPISFSGYIMKNEVDGTATKTTE